MAKRCASSRTRCSRKSPCEPRGQDHRRLVAGDPHLLQPLGQPHHGHIGDPELGDGVGGSSGLDRSAVDDDELRPVGEALRASDARRRRCPVLLALHQPSEPAPDHLGHRGRVVAARALDREAAVVARARHAVLEDDHRGDRVGAGQVGDVEALDPQRRLGQPERLLELFERDRSRGEVTRALDLVQRQRVRGVLGNGLHQAAFVATPRRPDVDVGAAVARRATH